MPESSQGGNQAPKEMSMEMRLLLAFLLMGAVMFITQYFVPKSPVPAKNAAPISQQTPAQKSEEAQSPPPEPLPETPAELPAVSEPSQPEYVIDTKLFRVSFSNRGGSLRKWQLKTFKGGDDKILDLANGASWVEYPFSLYFPGKTCRATSDGKGLAYACSTIAPGAPYSPKPGDTVYLGADANNSGSATLNVNGSGDKPCRKGGANLARGDLLAAPAHEYAMVYDGSAWVMHGETPNSVLYKQITDPDNLGVTYEYSDGHTTVRKRFRFEEKSYLAQISTEVTADGTPVPHQVEWRGGFGDLTVQVPASNSETMYFDVSANKLTEQRASAAAKGPVESSGNFSFAGVSDKYFAAVFLAEGASTVQETTFGDWVRTPLEEKPQNFAGVAVSDGNVNRFRLFVGPKDVQLLKSVDPKLEEVVNFGGWIPGIQYLAKPLFLIVSWANSNFVHNFGWSIVLVTVFLNMILFPLKLTNMKSMRKMQALKPQIDAINAKYKNISIRDPKKAQQNQEVMDLYKKYGVNPMGGCFPMLLQLPFFFAFYKVFTVSVEMRGANWLWVTDLSQAEHLPIHILPIIMIVSQFLMQKMTPQANVDPSQQKMMYMMPLIFGFMFYQLPSGLVLYYLTSNLVAMGQQWFFNSTDVARAAALSVQPAPKKKNGRK